MKKSDQKTRVENSGNTALGRTQNLKPVAIGASGEVGRIHEKPSGEGQLSMARKPSTELTSREWSQGRRKRQEEEKCRQRLHGDLVGGDIYRILLKAVFSSEVFEEGAIFYARDLVKKMKPRDPLEGMLIQQALWTHTRLAKLSALAVSQTSLEAYRVLNEACDRASNTFRRLMLALAEYRQPGRPSPLSIQQANLANQQVVQQIINAEFQTKIPPNELGGGPNEEAERKAIPTDP